MSDHVQIIDAYEPKKLPKRPERPDFWMVLGYSGGRWEFTSHTGYFSEKAAVRAARALPPQWTHRRVIRIPGEP